jgi:hypothetical protein
MPRKKPGKRPELPSATGPLPQGGGAAALPTPATVARDAPDVSLSFTDAFPFPGVILVLGFQGEGKTSLAYWLMEEYHKRRGTVGAVYKGPRAMRKWLPDWVARPQLVEQIPENAVVLISEAHQFAHARRSSSTQNLDLAGLASLARQKNSLIIFDTHHTRKLDLLELAEAKRVIFKRPSEGQVMIERREVKPFTYRALQAFGAAQGDSRKLAYVVDFERLRFGMVKVRQAGFWREELSTAMKSMGVE